METLDSLKSGVASGRLAGCTSIKLSDGLSEFPPELFALADSLTFLNLTNNQLTELPTDFDRFKQLKIAFFNDNCFEAFPSVLARCSQLSMVSFKNNAIAHIEPQALSSHLRWLILTNNQLKFLPASIGHLPQLQKCMLAGNQLKSVPQELANCQNLELIRLSANQLETIPDALLSLPRLSWIAYAGNPFCSSDLVNQKSQRLETVSADELTFGEVLGQGASGVIHKGMWAAPDQKDSPQTVAIKIFKGDITSDGSPLDEMRACIAAGRHPNLVSVLGRYDEGEKTGLVFSFIPPEYKNLGNPPSLDSCTRDTYDAAVSFSASQVLEIVRGIASVAAHLHQNGIMHGDLYAHNILINEAGHSILGDFGAASFYDVETNNHVLEKIEVRAFGCLLEDLLERCADGVPSLQVLRQLKDNCMQPSVSQRPLFKTICEAMAVL
ncbi:MAG: protein kinase [Cyanobacteria bacterium J06621_11]